LFGVTLGKYGRKVCCEFNKEIKCISLVDGNKMCIHDETTEEQEQNDDMQVGFCPLLPEVMHESFLDSLKEEGYTNFRIFKA
jgi:hypothetical protein